MVNGQGVIDLGFAAVKTVNGTAPDVNGNVQVTTSDIGLINPVSVANAANLNTYKTTGLFTVTAAVAPTLTNSPETTDAATLEVVPLANSGTGDVVQRWTTASGLWWRACYGGTWNAWQQAAAEVVATTTTLGVIKVGAGLSVAVDGTLSADYTNLPIASGATLGGVKVGAGLSIDGSGVLSISSAFDKLDRVNGIAVGLFIKGNALPSATTVISGDVATANFQTVTVTGTGAITWSLAGWPSSGNYGEMEFQVTNGGLASSHTFPAAVQWVKPDGTLTNDFVAYMTAKRGTTNFQASGVDFVIFWSSDGGTTIFARVM